jgi:hypothetical protein
VSPRVDLSHPYFGTLTYDEAHRTFDAHVVDARRGNIAVSLDPYASANFPHRPIDAMLPHVEATLDPAAAWTRASLERWDAVTAKIVERLLVTYNKVWRTYDEEGETVTRDVLDARAFVAHLRLRSFHVALPEHEGEDFTGTMWIDIGDLFWGHAIQASIWADGAINVDLVG